jgi:NADH dehydrogenase FAD-containing subunit
MPRLLIVGANFAGIAAAQAVTPDVDVTVVDRGPWFEWLPNIHELVSRVRPPSSLRVDRKRMVERAGHRFLRGEIRELDARAGIAVTDRGRRLGFDACIVAIGGVHDNLGVAGAGRWAFPFKSIADCDAIGKKLAALARRAKPFTVVIVGGGIEGIECLGEVLRRYRHHEGLHVHVVEAGPRLLEGSPRVVDEAIRAHAAPWPVEFHSNTRVAAVTKRGVRLEGGGRIAADLVVWNGGARAPKLLREAGLAAAARQWAPVGLTLQSRRFANVFLAGDAAGLPRPISKQAYFALQMGSHAGANAERFLAGKRPQVFRPASKPMLLAFGDLDTFLVGETIVLAGTALAFAKEAVLQATLAQLDPPTSIGAGTALLARVAVGLRDIALPELLSLRRLVRLPGVRVLRA